MNSQLPLNKVAFYSEDRINGSKVSRESFITTDSMLQNKNGITTTPVLPKGSLIAFSKEDILVGNIRPYLKKIWFADRNGGCSPDVLVLKAKPSIDPKFLYYALFRDDFFIHMMKGSKGTKMPRGDKNQILRFHIPEIGISDEKQIAAVLSALDSKIELNNRVNDELEAMAKTLYSYWFVQFDFPDKTGKPYKSSGGKMVWNKELKREIPDGWINGILGDIAELVRGVTYDSRDIKSKNESGVIPILRATNIRGNFIDLNEMVYVPEQNVSASQLLNKYDILFTMSSGSKEHIGKNGFFYYEEEVAFGAFCAKIVAKDLFRFYLYSYTQSDFMFTTIKNECLGTNINNLNGSLVKGFKIVIPPNNLIKSFNEKINSVYEKIGNNLTENQKLTELRDWLLPLIMNGQVKVKDEAEIELAMAVEAKIKYGK